MTSEEAKVTSSKTWHLPYHAVLNPLKVGVVFDTLAKFDYVFEAEGLVSLWTLSECFTRFTFV